MTFDQPKKRDIAMVFQNYALYPYMTVAANIGFPLKIAGVKKAERERRVREVAEMLGLTEYLERKPAYLSGGQRQRVAMGRAIVRKPSVFLMDEPLSNLDAKLRVQMRAEIADLQSRLGVTTVYVTHDQAEAMTLGHRVAVLSDGCLQQCDAPRVLYDRPANTMVAGFIGSPAMNLLDARLGTNGSVSLGGVEDPAHRGGRGGRGRRKLAERHGRHQARVARARRRGHTGAGRGRRGDRLRGSRLLHDRARRRDDEARRQRGGAQGAEAGRARRAQAAPGRGAPVRPRDRHASVTCTIR